MSHICGIAAMFLFTEHVKYVYSDMGVGFIPTHIPICMHTKCNYWQCLSNNESISDHRYERTIWLPNEIPVTVTKHLIGISIVHRYACVYILKSC